MKILVTGARGMLGRELVKRFGDTCLGVDLPEADVAVPGSILPVVDGYRPDVIVNTAAITGVDLCEKNPSLAEDVHHRGVAILTGTGVRLITISTDHVFTDGGGEYLTETSPVNPVNRYAASKYRGETAALENPANAVVRTSWLVGKKGMLPWMADRLKTLGEVSAVADQTACVTFVEDLAEALETMAFDDGHRGLYHCVNPGWVTPFFLACSLRQRLRRGRVIPVEWGQLGLPAPRPIWSALGTHREIEMPPLEEAMEIWLRKIL